MKKGVNPRQQIEVELRKWLRSHHGVIGYCEALRLGASPSIIKSKVNRGEWVEIHRGVYRDTATPPDPYQDLRAGCVATAGLGVVSHLSAAWVWGLVPQPPATPELTVTLGGGGYGHNGLRIHRSKDLDVARVVNRNAIVVTNPLRTLVDAAGGLLPRDLTEAVDSALARRLVSVVGLEAEIERLARPGRTGVGVLRTHLRDQGFTGAPEPSVLEAHMRRLVLTTGLPLPTVEHRAGADGEYRLDLAWADILFAVEVDGYAWHFSPEHLQRDETRRNQLQKAGWTLLVFTWRQVVGQPATVAREIAETYRLLSRDP